MHRDRNIDSLLHGNGNIIAAARKSGKSLSPADRRIILRHREYAAHFGFAPHTINALEMEGERGQRGIAPMPIDTIFVGEQDFLFHGWKIRLYNIDGDHPLNHSTVTTFTLIRLGLMPLDISLHAVIRECVKESIILTYFFLTYDVPKFVKGLVRK